MKKTINVLFAFTFALSCFFTSCANLEDSFTPENGDNGGNPTYSISGTVTGLGFEGQEPRDNSRTAMSDLSDIGEANIKYTVKAQKGDLVVTKEGSPFTLALPSAGEWTVSATGVDKTTQSTVLSTDSKVIFISPVSPTGYVNLEARPVITDDGFGKINLSFGTLPLKVSRVSVVCNDAVWQDLIDSSKLTVNLSGIKTADDAKIKSGSYSVDINFYDSNGVLCYNCTQTINVFNGFTTNTWIKHGSESYLVYKTAGSQKPGSAADFKLTDALLDQYVLRTIYVDPSFPDTSTGTWLAPYKSLDDAIAKCTDATKNYTINIKGTVEVSNRIIISKNILIKKAEKADSAKIKYLGTSERLFTVQTGTFTISNVDIEGPDDECDSNGAAIYNEGTLILNNVNLSKFKQATDGDKYGGCLYNAGEGTISITGGSITSCASAYGGAIYNAGEDIEIEDCTISSCTAQRGGAIYNDNAKKIKLSGNTSITSCTATESGGGIYLYSYAKVYMQDSASIKNCIAPETSGGGIYAAGTECRVDMKDSVYLDSASDIYLNTGASVTLNGNLTPPEAANDVAATITPNDYNAGIQILNENSAGLIAGNFKKFKVKPGADKNWIISKDGKLLDIIVVENINSLKTQLSNDSNYTMDSSTFIVSSSDISDKTLFNIESLNVSIDGGDKDSHGKIDLQSVQGRAFTISGNCDVKISNIDFVSNHDGSSYSTSYYGNYHGTGILVKSGAVVTIENCTFEKLSVDINRWSDSGNTGFAGIIEVENGGKVIIKNCIIKNSNLLSNGSWGGAVCIQEGGTAEISDTKIEQIIGGHAGGALMVLGECTMKNCTIVSNTSGDGAGIYLFNASDSAYSAHLLAENCIIKSNDACESRAGSGRHGGAGYINCNGIAEFKNCEITENSSYSSGKAFYVERGTLKLDETSREYINSSHNIVVKSSATYNGTTYGEDTTISNP